MDFLPEAIEAYVAQHTEKEPALLAELNHETWEKVLIPRMLSGHIQGRILSMFSHMINPKNILEIGTYTGYSALCFAEGLQAGGKIHTIDINEELEPMVSRYIDKAGLKDTIMNHVGDAMEIIPKLTETFDLVFIDADKTNYSNYFDLVIDKVRPGGYIIADNVLWSGKVVDEAENNDPDTAALKAYCTKIHQDDRVQDVLFPVRDGLMVARKK
ncbi:MAG: O-methyltransferase [Flavobacteriales bacterium]|nr:O-methyltransferase [Flavobacteriales bacterium]